MASSAQSQADKTVIGYPVTYAHAVPAPQPQVVPMYHQTYHQNPRNGPTLLCRVIIFAVAILAVMGLISFITWLILRPQVPEFRVDSASMSHLNTNSSSKPSLTATWQISLSVINPNTKLSISYDPLLASIFYDDWELSTTELAPFSQGKRNETSVKLQLAVVSQYVHESVVNDIESDRARGEVGFGVGVSGWVRFSAGSWKIRWRFIRVYCDGVRIGVSSNGGSGGNLMGPVKPCQVNI